MLSLQEGEEKTKEEIRCQAGRCITRHHSWACSASLPTRVHWAVPRPEPAHGVKGDSSRAPRAWGQARRAASARGCTTLAGMDLPISALSGFTWPSCSCLLREGGFPTCKPQLAVHLLGFLFSLHFQLMILPTWKNLPYEERLKRVESLLPGPHDSIPVLKGGCKEYGGSLFTRI